MTNVMVGLLRRCIRWPLWSLLLVVLVAAFCFALVRPPPEVRCHHRCEECVNRRYAIDSARKAEPHAEILFMPQEHGLFFRTVRNALASYHAQHGTYPRGWHELGFAFTGDGRYLVSEAGIRATKADGARWRPKRSQTIYSIAYADGKRYVIEAYDLAGKNLHRIDQDSVVDREGFWP
jgi:hypothetical protein